MRNILYDFTQVHDGSCNALVSTFKHLISAGDDGILAFIDLEGLYIVRKLNLQEEAVKRCLSVRPDVPRRLKCIFLIEDPENGGTVVVGTSYGDVYLVSIGTCV